MLQVNNITLYSRQWLLNSLHFRSELQTAMRKQCAYSTFNGLWCVHTFPLLLHLAWLNNDFVLLPTVYMGFTPCLIDSHSKFETTAREIYLKYLKISNIMKRCAWELRSCKVSETSSSSWSVAQTQHLQEVQRKKPHTPKHDWCKYYWENVCHGQGIDKQ